MRRLLDELEIQEVAFGEIHWREAVDAYRRSFGDCMTYAVARLTGEPLLCVGDDFPRTDLEIVPLGSPPRAPEPPS